VSYHKDGVAALVCHVYYTLSSLKATLIDCIASNQPTNIKDTLGIKEVIAGKENI
jgi:hypothetical protein